MHYRLLSDLNFCSRECSRDESSTEALQDFVVTGKKNHVGLVHLHRVLI